MEYYRHTQYGFWITLPSLLTSLTLLVLSWYNFSWPMALTGVLLGTLSLLFYRLVVTVTDEGVRISFGIGLIHKTIRLDRIQSVAAVRNKFWYGWGIRCYPGGWLYNISGLDAVELEISERFFYRIGTDDPIGLTGAIQARLRPVVPKNS